MSRPLFFHILLCFGLGLINVPARAQTPTVVQFFLPEGELPSREISFTMKRNFGITETLKTDKTGKFMVNPDRGRETVCRITVESDKRAYDLTTVEIRLLPDLSYAPVFLRPFKGELPAASKTGVDEKANEENSPAEARAAYLRAMRAVNEGRVEAAISEFTRSLTAYPRYLRALNQLGLLYFNRNRLDEAAAAFLQACSVDARGPNQRFNLGATLNRQGKTGEAAQALTDLLNDHPSFSTARITLADALIRIQQWDEASQQLRQALADANLNKEASAEAHFLLSRILVREERYNAAAAEAEKAIAAKPDWPNAAQAHLLLGSVLLQLKKSDDAEKALLKAYEIGGKRAASAQLLLGQLYYDQQKYEAAQSAYEQFLKDVPNSPNTPRVRELIEKAKTAKK
jgi:TolA-binding protein